MCKIIVVLTDKRKDVGYIFFLGNDLYNLLRGTESRNPRIMYSSI